MSTQLAISSPVPFAAAPEYLSPENTPVLDYDSSLREAARSYRVSTMRIAYWGHRMKMCEGWQSLGYEAGPRGEENYREDLGIPRSSYYRALRIGQTFHQLSLPDLERIPVENANTLLAVNPMIFNDHNWVQEAKTKSNLELAELVTARNKAIGDNREPLSSMNFRVPTLARKAIDSMLQSFMKKHELSSKSQALECLIADRHDQSNLLASMNQARKLVEASATLLRHKKLLQGTDADEWLKLAVEVLSAGYEEAVQAARTKAERRKATGGRS